MLHLLCIHFNDDAHPEAIADVIDGLEWPFEWRDIPKVSEVRLLTIRFASAEEAVNAMNGLHIAIATKFVFSQLEEVADV